MRRLRALASRDPEHSLQSRSSSLSSTAPLLAFWVEPWPAALGPKLLLP
eukprot:SAG11_NODE_12254_length_713_cov_0.802932_1_plen_48_part_10